MKICMVGYTKFESDGRLHRYAMSLLEKGHSVDVIGLGSPVSTEPIESYGVHVYRVYSRDFGESGPVSYLMQLMTFFFKSFFSVTKLQKKNRYDIIHFHNIPDFGIFCTLLARLMGAKVILDIHDLVPEFYRRKFKVGDRHWVIVILKQIERMSCHYADHVITVTDLWKDRLIERSVPKEKCSVIMNVPIETLFNKQPFNKHPRGNPFYLTYHGNLAEQTGVDLLIHAVHQLRSQIPEIQLLIIGSGHEAEDYKTLSSNLQMTDIVTFKNNVKVTEIADSVKHAHVAVDPKRQGVYAGETLSVKAMEYLAMGIPLIVARTEAALIYFPEKSVRFFEPDNVDSLAEAILDLYKNPEKRNELYRHADDFNSVYNWAKMKKVYLSILAELCQGRN
jgi:glycosyltransferase involved in cell wall biosynthesis